MEQVVLSGWQRDVAPNIFGYEACCPGHSFGPAVRPYYLLHYVLEGEGEFLSEGELHRVGRGDIFVIRPGVVTTYRTGASAPWRYAWLGFHYPGELPFLKTAVIRQPPVRHIFTFIRDHQSEEGLDGKIFSMTHELLWLLDTAHAEGARQYAAYTRKYLDSAYMQNISIDSIAQRLHIDRRYLTRQFKTSYGMPPQEYLMRVRLDKAAQFLQQGYCVTDAAQMAGFMDLPNFSRYFRRRYGVVPREYRGKQVD